NTTGGTTAGARNVVSGNKLVPGNTGDGIDIDGHTAGNVVLGNYIGTAADGTTALGNNRFGVAVDGANLIGGTAVGARNVISGNVAGAGLAVGNHVLVQGNFIGTDVTGRAAVGNGEGIHVVGSYNTIGGLTAEARNIISGNSEGGIDIEPFAAGGAQYNLVAGNYIGTDVSGTSALTPGRGV